MQHNKTLVTGTEKTKGPLVVVLTGAAGGMGSEIANQLIAAGHIVHAVGRNLEGLALLSLKFDNNREQFFSYEADLSQESACRRLCKEILSNTDYVDWVVHAAGSINPHESSTPVTREAVESAFSVNATAPILLHELLTPHLRSGGGSVFIASTAGLWGNAHFPLYSASKSALITFARSVAQQYEDGRLSSLVLCPGPTNTAMRSLVADDSHTKQSPAFVASIVSSFILGVTDYKNGDVIVVRDGKATLHE